MKITILDMQRIAKKRGGQCLSVKYINSHTKLAWQCKDGHQWESTPAIIKQGSWCPVCGGTQKNTIEEMKKIAKKRGGQCLSVKYINSHTKLAWQCKHGHQWDAAPTNIQIGYWCPFCAGVQKGTIEEMEELAEEHGGKCLSKEYTNCQTKLIWQCKEGHKWQTRPSSIKQGSWCPFCVGVQRGTIEEMQKIARERDGQCLSKEYINSKTKLQFQCSVGHKWEAVPNNIQQGHWCFICGSRRS
jgi:hypothetical protein